MIKRFFVREKSLWKLKVRWWNIGTRHSPFSMGIEQRIEVTRDGLRLWRPYDYSLTQPAASPDNIPRIDSPPSRTPSGL